MIDPAWGLTAASVLGAALNAIGFRAGFGIWIFSNIGWVIFYASSALWPSAVLFIAYLVLSVVGFFMWPGVAAKRVQEENTVDVA